MEHCLFDQKYIFFATKGIFCEENTQPNYKRAESSKSNKNSIKKKLFPNQKDYFFFKKNLLVNKELNTESTYIYI